MNPYARWFKRVVWFGIVVNMTFAIIAISMPNVLLNVLHLGSVTSPVWLTNYSVLLILLSCFYIPAAHNPQRYIVNAWLLVATRLIPAMTFFIGAFLGYMSMGFITLGIGDFLIGCVEGILLILMFRLAPSTDAQVGNI